eukprot:CAMPEP_0173391402 /NCGR_PEP_ID=MMETSP1356-20130122/18364_1 /TAXON_ID=77927 ORGANISM="Hemiselmis virescens, Strain PCC157" /NCGR_SAMPLE_ID=MMETSP1356 /ASSEMBLY_ACC=CAM_ASM_000847 /LENGTH=76 /DNA_ID=CAMNT_0014349027 /DNA_START=64 /DNA_END=290 /DNA_ORIENTATION=+
MRMGKALLSYSCLLAVTRIPCYAFSTVPRTAFLPPSHLRGETTNIRLQHGAVGRQRRDGAQGAAGPLAVPGLGWQG